MGATADPTPPRLAAEPDEDWVAGGALVVRASGASAARTALATLTGGTARAEPEDIQLIMRVTVPHRLSAGPPLVFPGCTITSKPVDDEGGDRHGIVVLTAATHRLSIHFSELQPLMWQPVPVDRALHALFSSAIGHLLATGRRAGPPEGPLDDHGVGHYLLGLVELVLRSALRDQLQRADTAAARRREAIDYVTANLADPDLTADRVADALFISRRRLYQLFDDGEGISGRIRRLRIERAKELLADPTRSLHGIGELSRQCGFANPAHFSRTFRKIVGRTPREYRTTPTP